MTLLSTLNSYCTSEFKIIHRMSNISNSFPEGSLYRCHFQQVKQTDRYIWYFVFAIISPGHPCIIVCLFKTFLDQVSQVTETCSKLVLLGSYTIWNVRHSLDWSSGGIWNLIPWRANHHHFPHSVNHFIRFVSVCIHYFAHVTLCHCIGGSTLDMMWT